MFGIMDAIKPFRPVYLRSYKEGLLQEKISDINDNIGNCSLCPHNCGINRRESPNGQCKSGDKPLISSFCAHFGEESPLVGIRGSGTIFFANCNLSCVFCQNYDISQYGIGEEISHSRLAEIMIHLQNQGCHNINFVSPSNMVYSILNALPEAIDMGLRIPLVYNSGGYDLPITIKLLDGVFDIYMPDMKYMDNRIAKKYSGADNYVEFATESILEMHQQVGDLVVDQMGIAQRGLIIRHLIMPGNISDTKKIIDFVRSLSSNTYFNLMDQYHPSYKANDYEFLNRRITSKEYQEAYDYAISVGLNQLAV